MTEVEKALQYFTIAVPENEEQSKAFFQARKALSVQQEVEKPKPLTLEEVAGAYLDICDNDCVGDNSVGIPCCQFYEWPDVDDDEYPCPGECRLNAYLHKPKEE